MQDSSVNHLPQMQAFASIRSTPFMEIDDKGGEIGTKYVNASRGEVVVGHGQRGSSIE